MYKVCILTCPWVVLLILCKFVVCNEEYSQIYSKLIFIADIWFYYILPPFVCCRRYFEAVFNTYASAQIFCPTDFMVCIFHNPIKFGIHMLFSRDWYLQTQTSRDFHVTQSDPQTGWDLNLLLNKNALPELHTNAWITNLHVCIIISRCSSARQCFVSLYLLG